jgi:uncharacterized membrane protein
MRLSPYTFCLLALVPTSAYSAGDSAATSDEAPSQGTILVMECQGLSFVVELKQEEAWLFLPDYSGSIPQVPSASGSKYEGNNITFWSKGEEASLDYGKNSYRDCRNNPALAVWEAAKLRGVDFRGVGNEPGWVLETQGDSLSLKADYGETHYQFTGATEHTDSAAGQTILRAANDADTIEITLEHKACQDTMADASYETTVSIQLGDRTLQGCGKALH